ncbi:hypothetical protein [Infirmifilum sp. SLHALR2]|nr:MAG: hypothetical protein B7L53_07935 [Thermofilum sp. NZ13]
MSSEPSYEELVGRAANRVGELFKEKGVSVAVLAGPGSSRLEVARRIPGSVVVSYKLSEPLKELQEEDRAELLRFEGAEPFADGMTLAGYVRKKSPARVIVVPESTIEAIRVYRSLSERLGKGSVALVFTPGVHKEEFERRGAEQPGEAEVNYTPAFNAFKVMPEGGKSGVSLKLLQHHGTGEWEELRRGAEALRRLSPGSLGLRGALVNAGRRALSSLGERLAEELYAAVGGAVVASALEALASPQSSLAVVAKVIGYSFPPGLLLEIARGLIGVVRGEPEKEHVKQLAELVQAAIIAAEFVSDERLEGVADEVASQWGLSLREFRKLVENLRKLATQEVATEDELRKLREEVGGDLKALEQRLKELFEQRIDQLEKGLEDRLGQLEERVEELEKRVGRIEDQLRPLRALTGVYQEPGDLGFDLERGKFWVGKEYDLVTSGRFMEHAGKLLEALERGELVVVTGPRGVGKSVLTRYALARLLQSGHWRVYRAKTLDEESAAEMADSLARVADNSPWRLAVLYDPSAPLFYEPGYELPPPPGVGPTVWALARLHRVQGGRVPVVVVLPDDLYEQVKDRLKGAYVLRVDLRQEDFLTDIVRAYSGEVCSEEVYERIAREVTRYEGDYTLVARYAGEWLSEAGECNEKAVREALEAGVWSAEAFIALFIYKAVFRGKLAIFQKMAVPFIARAKLGPLPLKWLERFPVLKRGAYGGYVVKCLLDPLEHLTDGKKEFIKEWLSQPKEDVVEGVIRGIAKGTLSRRLQRLAEKGLVSPSAVEVARGMEERVRLVLERLRSARFDGECRGEQPVEVFFKALASDPELRELAEENSYHFAALVGLAHTVYSAESLLGEAGFPEGLKGWLTVGDEMPRSARWFLVETAPAFRLAVNPCQVLKSVHQRAEEEKGDNFISLLAALGALAASGGELEGCLDEAATVARLVLDKISLWLERPVLTRLSEALKKLVGKLMEEGRLLEAVDIAYKASKREPRLASDLLQTVEQRAGGLDRLNPLARTLYENTDYLARKTRGEWLVEWARRVEAFLKGLEEDVVGLYARALLGARLASAFTRISSAGKAREWAGEARRALEQLERLDRSELAKGLERLLRVWYPLIEPGEAAERLLENLKLAVLSEGALIELLVDAEEALRLADELHVIAEKLGLLRLVESHSFRARAMLLAGRKREDVIGEIRESWELAHSWGFIGLSEDIVEAITAEYVASFLLEGKPREALEQYREYGFLIRNPRVRAALLALMLACGAEEMREDMGKVRRRFEEYRSRALAYSALRPLAVAYLAKPLAVLYEEIEEEEAWDSLGPLEWVPFADILGIAREGNVGQLLWLLEEPLGLGELVRKLEPHLEGLSALDVLEVVSALVSSRVTFVEVVHQACVEGRAGLAKVLAKLWQEELEGRGLTLAARLWGELAESLEGGCGEEFREALVRLFYLYV